MQVPFAEAKLTVRCEKHNAEVDFMPDELTTQLFTSADYMCPGLGAELSRLIATRRQLSEAGQLACAREYIATHPNEQAMYPPGWMPVGRFRAEDYPEHIRDKIKGLDRERQSAIMSCGVTWVVILEKKDHEQATNDDP